MLRHVSTKAAVQPEFASMNKLTYSKHERLSLKSHPDFNEKWLQARIAEDPNILGLGDVVLIERERSQERAGRLDILLASIEHDRRYEVELMLGATDESHIIRCIEYWDIERRRYPAYDHCAVLVAEDITSRFLNVLSLLAGTVPLVAIQLNALTVADKVVLDFVRVLDQRMLRRDDVTEGKIQAADRNYWLEKSGAPIIQIADEVLAMINEKAEPKQQLNYNKGYIGLTDGTRARNFIYFRPRKQFLRVVIPSGGNDNMSARFNEAGLETEQDEDKLMFNVTASDLAKHRPLIASVIHEVVVEEQS
jgi:hypothetical protein